METTKKVWGTAYGLLINIDNLSHQHLSNITYFNKLVIGCEVPEVIIKEINDRFGGIILPYHPLISFSFEIKKLVDKGYTNGEINSDIIVDGVWIGKIKYE